jgi:hypothetical protein
MDEKINQEQDESRTEIYPQLSIREPIRIPFLSNWLDERNERTLIARKQTHLLIKILNELQKLNKIRYK